LKIGILGGTFDPIHLGHLRTAEEVGEKLGLEKVFLIPSASPPHKTNNPVTPFKHRLAMARMASRTSTLLEALDLEGNRPGLSYTIETLKELQQMYNPETELFFILGNDTFLEIETWREYKKLFDYAHFVVIQRAGHEEELFDSFLVRLREDITKTKDPGIYTTSAGMIIMIMTSTFLEISSTRIRKTVADGRSIHFLVPDTVRKYILQEGLYDRNTTN